MAGRSILYLGGSEFAAPFCKWLADLPACSNLYTSPTLEIPADTPADVELVIFEAGPAIPQSGHTLASLVESLADKPLLAITSREQEHRGIAAVAAGAQGYVCADIVDDDELESAIEHAVQRFRLLATLSERDSTVL